MSYKDKRLKKKTLILVYYFIAIPVLLELSLLILGYRRYINIEYSIESTPSSCIIGDSKLGFSLTPGIFDITINKALNYRATHTADSLRKTVDFNPDSTKENSIYFFGCSYTYGMGVNDEETFSSIVQKHYPHCLIKNYGVPGYGTVQSYLQIKKLAKTHTLPDYIILNYASFHDERNALSPSYRKHLKLGFERSNENTNTDMAIATIPYVEIVKDSFQLKVSKWEDIYSSIPGREVFASINLLQNMIDESKQNKVTELASTFILIKEIDKLCQSNNAKLIVTGLSADYRTLYTLQKLKNSGFKTLDISIDLKNKKFNNTPYDAHPNKYGHLLYGEKLIQYLDNAGLNR